MTEEVGVVEGFQKRPFVYLGARNRALLRHRPRPHISVSPRSQFGFAVAHSLESTMISIAVLLPLGPDILHFLGGEVSKITKESFMIV